MRGQLALKMLLKEKSSCQSPFTRMGTLVVALLALLALAAASHLGSVSVTRW